MDMKRKTHNISKKRGFTLLELLVVISIIGILLALGVVAFTTAQRKSRDAKRRADIKSMQDGFEQYYAGNNGYGTCAAMQTSDNFPGGPPVDPKDAAPYVYNCTAPHSSFDYCICARLEAGGGNATGNDCAGYGSTSDGDFYCLTNLQ
ncbi:MAG: fimbrial protein pilin [Microgenomates bacterium 39_7]|nr:MAG: fimbrial protein pilin [Microgenomates bacterium 39_7]